MTMDKSLFLPENALVETLQFNKSMTEKLAALPDPWSTSPEENRQNRLKGIGAFPAPVFIERAQTIEIKGKSGNLQLRQFTPEIPETESAFLHIHPGGWMYGSASHQDTRLQQIADRVGCMVFSVEYGLSPECPYPAAVDDCETAALWLVRNGSEKFGLKRFAIGGESAGAHLSVLTLLRLRDRHKLTSFHGAFLNAGMYDLRITPSARKSTGDRLILNLRDIENFVENFLQNNADVQDSEVSPIFADLSDLPTAMFVVGTADPLLDDTLFMFNRWVSNGNSAELEVVSHGCHVFNSFPIKIATDCNLKIDGFLRTVLNQ